MGSELQPGRQHQASGLVDVLDRVLDKGLVVAGDIKVSLADESLTRRTPSAKRKAAARSNGT